jgi:hypothetical protein
MRLQQLIERDPIHARGLHRHTRHAAGDQPVDESLQAVGERRKGLHGVRITVGRHGDVMLRRTAVDPGHIRLQTRELGGRTARRAAGLTTVVSHRMLLHTQRRIRGPGRRYGEQSPKRDHGRVTARVTTDATATPRATLANGLCSTTGGSASGPGCARDRSESIRTVEFAPVSAALRCDLRRIQALARSYC